MVTDYKDRTYDLGLDEETALGYMEAQAGAMEEAWKAAHPGEKAASVSFSSVKSAGTGGASVSPSSVALIGSYSVTLGRKNMVAGQEEPSRKNTAAVNAALRADLRRELPYPGAVDDLTYTGMVVAGYHEMAHLEQVLDGADPRLRVNHAAIGNGAMDYYNRTWHKQPVEIDAERNGIKMAAEAMEAQFPGKGEELVLRYVNYRADKTPTKGPYIIKAPEGGFSSLEEADAAFGAAYQDSFEKPRGYNLWLNTPDDYVMGTISDGKSAIGPLKTLATTRDFVSQMNHATGEEFDAKLVALRQYLQPSCCEEWGLDPETYSTKAQFGRSLEDAIGPADEYRRAHNLTNGEPYGMKKLRSDREKQNTPVEPERNAAIDKAMQKYHDVKVSGPNGEFIIQMPD